MLENGHGKNAGGEFYIDREAVTIESLLADNRSIEAESRRSEWEENREAKRLTLLDTCSDARIVTPNPTSSVVIRSIAAGGSLESFAKLIRHKSIDNIHIMGHHSGKSVVNGQAPKGCGGLGVKEDQIKHDKIPHSEVEEWISENVCESDSLYNAFVKAVDALEFSEKEILLSTQDHLKHYVLPMAGFFGGIKAPFHYDDFSHYKSSEVYKDGIPSLPLSELAGTTFEEYLYNYYEEQFPMLNSRFAEHDSFSQETQNPKMLLITTNVRPPEVCYPNLTKRPNKVFVETLAREKINDEIQISEKDIKSVIAQAQYPITRFARMDTVFIETGDINQSLRIARELEERKWFAPWVERKGHQILIGESRGGKLEDLRKL